MRIALNIDDDVLIAVKEVAARGSKTAGHVASDPLRRPPAHGGRETPDIGAESEPEFGFRPFLERGAMVTNERIDRLREETGD